MKVNDVMYSKAINEMIRVVDIKLYKEQYVKYKILNNSELIDIEAQVCLKAGVSVGILKCYYGIN